MSKRILAGNWKLNLGPKAAAELTSELANLAGNLKQTEIWIAPTSVSIPACITSKNSSPIKVGAQNVYSEASGAFTGENSASILKEAGCEFAIVGHSERRALFSESNELCAKRALGSLSQGLTVVFCIGETLNERESEITNKVLSEQLSYLYQNLNKSDISKLVIAYEPVWAIGTGKVASLEQIAETHDFIDKHTRDIIGTSLKILYGGSVKGDNFAEIAKIDKVAGALVGGASLKAQSFIELISISEEI